MYAYVHTHTYYDDLAHKIMETQKSHDLHLQAGDPGGLVA